MKVDQFTSAMEGLGYTEIMARECEGKYYCSAMLGKWGASWNVTKPKEGLLEALQFFIRHRERIGGESRSASHRQDGFLAQYRDPAPWKTLPPSPMASLPPPRTLIAQRRNRIT